MRSLLNRFLMRVEFSLQHSQFSMLFTKNWEQQNLCQNLIEEKEKRNLALEGSIMQILLSTQRHWRRSNEMLQGRLLDNSFTEKSKSFVGWIPICYIPFTFTFWDISPPLTLTNHYFSIGKSRIATEARFSGEHLSNLTATKYWQFWKWGFSFPTNHLLKSWNTLVYIVTFWDPFPPPSPLIES